MNKKDFAVLLVEDNSRDASLLEGAFSKLGLVKALHTVRSLDAAIEYLSGKGPFADRSAYPRPSLILVNLAISRASDFKMLRWMRRQGLETKRIPVVILAAARQPPGFDHAYDLGAVTYLVKPVDLEALRSIVKAAGEFWRIEAR